MYVTLLTKIIGKAVYLKTDSHAPAVDRMADQFEIRSWYRFCSSLDDKKKEKKQTVRVGVVLVLLADHECERKVRVFATLRRLLVLGLFTGTLPHVIPPMHHLGFPLGA